MASQKAVVKNLSRLFSSINYPRRALDVQVYISYDILYSAPLKRYSYILNPANEALCGTVQPYFPIGGPVPAMIKPDKALSSSRWGGMEAGENMMYGVQVLDGCIHDECGPQLLRFLQSLPERSPFVDKVGQRIRCPVGEAVKSPAFGSLAAYFDGIIHTVPPFQDQRGWEVSLYNCYINSFHLVWPSRITQPVSVATVLLGAGCRGIAIDNAARVAATACQAFAFGVVGGGKGYGKEDSVCTAPRVTVERNCEDKFATAEAQPIRTLHFVLREEEHCHILTDYFIKQTAQSCG
jgi:O-acetyl-ADP-ribose deacetylase (regulator of RNase III)